MDTRQYDERLGDVRAQIEERQGISEEVREGHCEGVVRFGFFRRKLSEVILGLVLWQSG